MEHASMAFDVCVANAVALNPPEPGDYISETGLLMCGKCKSTRQIRKYAFDKEYILPIMCKCREEKYTAMEAAQEAERLESRKKIALPTEKYRSMTFEISDIPIPEAENYVRNWTYMLENNIGLLIHGEPGCGKTYMAAAIANRLIELGEWVYMDNMAALATRMNDQFHGGREECLNRVRSCRLMILDDFGAEKSTTTVGKNVYELINTRIETGKPMIVTTNMAPATMISVNDIGLARIYSRLKSLHTVKVEGEDRRVQGTRNRFADVEKILRGETK